MSKTNLNRTEQDLEVAKTNALVVSQIHKMRWQLDDMRAAGVVATKSTKS